MTLRYGRVTTGLLAVFAGALLSTAAGPVTAAAAFQAEIPSSPAPANALYVSANTGDDANPGTVQRPLRTAAAAVRRATGGTMTTIVLRGGEYRESLGGIFKPVTLQPYPGEEVWFKGSTVIPGTRFVPDGSAWRLDGWNPDICRPGPDGKACVNPPDITQGNPLGGDPAMVFADGRPLQQVASRAQVRAGTFHWDGTRGTLVVGTDPRVHRTEVSHLRYAVQFHRGSENSVLRGLGFAQYATSQDYRKQPAVIIAQAAGIVLDGNTVTHNAAAGIAAHASGLRLTGNHVTWNGFNGVLSHKARNLIMSGNRFVGNNQERIGLESSASLAGAGVKATFLENAVIKDNVFEGNQGTGFWCDLSCDDVTMVRNLVKGNTKHGLYYEVSARGLVASNMLTGNGQYGLKISGSNHVRVYNNTLADNAQSILVAEDPRPHLDRCNADNCPSQEARAKGITWDTADVTLMNNIFAGRSTKTPLIDTVDANSASSGKRVGAGKMIGTGQMDNNGYLRSASDGSGVLVKWAQASGGDVAYTSLAKFRETGREANGRYLDGGTAASAAKNGLQTTAESLADSPAESGGRPLPADVAAAIGVRAGVPVALAPAVAGRNGGRRPAAPRSHDRLHAHGHAEAHGHRCATSSPQPTPSATATSPRPTTSPTAVPTVVPTVAPTASSGLTRPVHYLRHPVKGHTLMTLNGAEADRAVRDYGYELHGVGFLAAASPSSGAVPVYRLLRRRRATASSSAARPSATTRSPGPVTCSKASPSTRLRPPGRGRSGCTGCSRAPRTTTRSATRRGARPWPPAGATSTWPSTSARPPAPQAPVPRAPAPQAPVPRAPVPPARLTHRASCPDRTDGHPVLLPRRRGGFSATPRESCILTGARRTRDPRSRRERKQGNPGRNQLHPFSDLVRALPQPPSWMP